MKDKYFAALLALLFGAIGLQKLYLGNKMEFTITLIFAWTLFPLFFGIWDAFNLYRMNYHEFNKRYNPRYKLKYQ